MYRLKLYFTQIIKQLSKIVSIAFRSILRIGKIIYLSQVPASISMQCLNQTDLALDILSVDKTEKATK